MSNFRRRIYTWSRTVGEITGNFRATRQVGNTKTGVQLSKKQSGIKNKSECGRSWRSIFSCASPIASAEVRLELAPASCLWFPVRISTCRVPIKPGCSQKRRRRSPSTLPAKALDLITQEQIEKSKVKEKSSTIFRSSAYPNRRNYFNKWRTFLVLLAGSIRHLGKRSCRLYLSRS